jgi:hypothetical protein
MGETPVINKRLKGAPNQRLNRKHSETLITEAIYQKTLIPWLGMFLFPFSLISFELFYILFQGPELRNFSHFFSPGFFIGCRFTRMTVLLIC